MKIKAVLLASVALIVACQDKESAPAQALSSNVVGQYIYGQEVETFNLCGAKEAYWATGDVKLLEPLREKALKLAEEKNEPYQPVYVNIDYVDLGKAKDGFAAEYDSVIEIKKATIVEKCDK
ncbi:hypothetical protein A4G18_02670 [Pasteurellaceae bacterium Pebbles2]|nr:hypothetical protein [Pasteurellaceae bacterium Pebbles2]